MTHFHFIPLTACEKYSRYVQRGEGSCIFALEEGFILLSADNVNADALNFLQNWELCRDVQFADEETYNHSPS